MAATRGNNKKKDKKAKVTDPLWKKINGGSLQIADGRTFYKGETFNAPSHMIPKAFMDSVECLTPPEEIKEKSAPKFFLREIVGTAEQQDDPDFKVKYDVIDVNNKVVSEKPLSKKKAEKYILKLES